MGTFAGAAFNRIAAEYDSIWSRSTVGRLQRAAVWRRIDPLVKAGDRLLDIGCGTGEDALHMMGLGAEVQGIDASEEMVRKARARGVQARQLAIEALSEQAGTFDVAISNFGALNCVCDMEGMMPALGRLIRPGGYLAICVIGACCAWEVGYFLRRGAIRKAFRRWGGEDALSSIGVHVHYYSVKKLRRTLWPEFELTGWYGIGLCVPPSYVTHLSDTRLTSLGSIDTYVAGWPLLRALSDHRLLLFKRL